MAGARLSPLNRFSVNNLLGTYELRFTNELGEAYDLRDQVLASQPGLDARVFEVMSGFTSGEWLKAEIITDVVERSGYRDARRVVVGE